MAYKDPQLRRQQNADYYRRKKAKIIARRQQLMHERGEEILARRRLRYARDKQILQIEQDEKERAAGIQQAVDAATRRALETPGNCWLLQVAILTAHCNPIEEERKKLAA